MRLMSIEQFRTQYFEPNSRPDGRTVRSWIDDGLLRGKNIGRRYYVDQDAWEGQHVDNPLVGRVLAEQS